jgi:hypothetical protein
MKRTLHVLAVASVVVVAVVGGIYVAHGLAGARRVAAAKTRAHTDIAQGLPAARRRSVRAQHRLEPELASLGTPTFSWQELDCRLDTDDAGWMVEDYVQECAVSNVRLVPVRQAPPGDCRQDAGSLGHAALHAGATVWRGRSTVLASADPYTRGCPDGLLGASMLTQSRVLVGHRPRSLASSPAWIVIHTGAPVSRTVLGCDPWSVVFCNRPVDKPVLY